MNTRVIVSWSAMLIVLASGYVVPALAAEVPQVKPDKGLVIFYRMDSIKGKAIRFNLKSAEGPVGQLLSGTILYKYLEPGKHSFWVQGVSLDGQDTITVNAEAGKISYIKGETLWGWPAGRPKFRKMSESQAKADLANLK